jgi:sugar diacid utilization regulator
LDGTMTENGSSKRVAHGGPETAGVNTRQPQPRSGRAATPPAGGGAALAALRRENATLQLLLTIHDRLGALVLEGADAIAITGELAGLLARPVLLLDAALRVISLEAGDGSPQPGGLGQASLVWEPSQAYVDRVLQTMAGERRALRLPPLPAWGVNHGCVLAPIGVSDSTLGYLAILEPAVAGGPAEADLLAAQHAANVYALALMRERLADEVTTELRDQLLEGLLDGHVTDDAALQERARRLGYDGTLTYRVLVLRPDVKGTPGTANAAAESGWAAGWRRRLLEGAAELIRERAPRAIVTRRRDDLVVLAPDSRDLPPADLGRAAVRYGASLYPNWLLTVGVGGPCEAARDIARSYGQARRTAEIALRFGRRGEVVTFESLGLYRLLFQVTDRAELRAFVDQVLGGLLAYDQKHRTDFTLTLQTFLSHNNSVQATARDLFVHVNTAAYRMQRIQTITGLDLSTTEDCLMARVALMILEDESAQ